MSLLVSLFLANSLALALEAIPFPNKGIDFTQKKKCTVAHYCPSEACVEMRTCQLEEAPLKELFYLYLHQWSNDASLKDWRDSPESSKPLEALVKRLSKKGTCSDLKTTKEKAVCILRYEQAKKRITVFSLYKEDGAPVEVKVKIK